MGNLTARYVTLKPTAPLPIPPIPAKLAAARKAMSETKPKRGRPPKRKADYVVDAPRQPC